MKFNDFKEELLKSPEAKAEYDRLAPEYEIISAIVNARIKLNLTQQQLADRIGIDRTNISKLENGKLNPTISTLQKIAKGMNMNLKLELVPKQ